MAFMWYFFACILLVVRDIQAQRTVYTFEDASHLNAFSASSTSTLARSTTRYKDGTHSMKWTWASGDEITHSISPAISGSELRGGGIKLWLYNTNKRSGESLTVSFRDSTGTISQFTINLDFTGWRAVWVSYNEALTGSRRNIDTMKITAPTTSSTIHAFYFDLIRLVNRLRGQSRDTIVPTITPLYTPNNFWQQTYRWSQATPTAITDQTPSETKLADMNLIATRLDNWFVKQSQTSNQFTGNVKRRWDSLQGDVNRANTEFADLNIAKSVAGVITGTPLYSDESEYDDKKFGFVMERVLLPMALDYHIRSRTADVNAVAAAELTNLNGDAAAKTAAIQTIAGGNSALQTTFSNALGSVTPYTEMKVKEAINALNNKRKANLQLLLEYIEDQGFTDGSAIGSLDHEMNNAGAGFMNAVYVLRNVLQDAGSTSDYVATMKWYNDFGEVYQDPFEFAGTTADRMRTISIWRLFAVLMMPTSTTQEKLAKIRDMEALGRWYVIALSPNEGFAGTLKPDFVGFHHNSYYASAYTPHAMHKAALIQYLLSGTAFDFDAATKKHIKKGLEIMRVVSVKYSSPNSVSGRFPGFTRAILAKSFPAYAYIGATAPSLVSGSLGAITTLDSGNIKMFLRLYDTANSDVNEYLGDGTIFTSIYYLNSIGAINIMEEINSKATTMNIAAEASPTGFWSLNYAAFVVYRRNNWAVSVKGFNKYVWDFEASSRQNVFGLYQSHGALLVANSEAALQTYDIDNGWDWTRHPGTTTIKMNLEDLISENRRYYQPMELAGGVRLVGGGDTAAGVFGMEFSQPPYRWETGAFQANIDFTFKKSVFFADFLIICLGTGITSSNSLATNITQTTLFQTKLLDAANPSSIYINTTAHSLNTDLTKAPSFFGSGSVAAVLRDVNGNGYYIPKAGDTGLNVAISLQTSRDQRGRTRETSARYATAWLDHGVNPTDKSYEFAILVNKPLSTARALATQQQGNSPAYKVLHQDNKAHVVEIPNCPRPGETQYGYVFFDKSVRTPGPVRRVNKVPCIVMVEEVDSQNLYISVSSPGLNFNITREIEIGSQINGQERFYSVSMGVEVQVFVKNAVNVATGNVTVNGDVVQSSDKASHVVVNPKPNDPTEGRVIRFLNLTKGFSKEVKLTRGSVQA